MTLEQIGNLAKRDQGTHSCALLKPLFPSLQPKEKSPAVGELFSFDSFPVYGALRTRRKLSVSHMQGLSLRQKPMKLGLAKFNPASASAAVLFSSTA